MSNYSLDLIIRRSGKMLSCISVFLLTVNSDHVLQDQDPLGQDLQGLPELLHGLALNNTIMFMLDNSSNGGRRKIYKCLLPHSSLLLALLLALLLPVKTE